MTVQLSFTMVRGWTGVKKRSQEIYQLEEAGKCRSLPCLRPYFWHQSSLWLALVIIAALTVRVKKIALAAKLRF